MTAHRDPTPSSTRVSRQMSAQRSRNTDCELALRRSLHARGLRYRVHQQPIPGLRREADIVFGSKQIAVFVDGCFWHGCPEHGSVPTSNRAWWTEKLRRNRRRDIQTDEILRAEGWEPIRIWEHENPTFAAARIASLLAQRHRTA